MSKCRQCNVNILDDTEICPLCRCVVERQEEAEQTYPDIWLSERRMVFYTNICLFVILALSAVLAGINYRFYTGRMWAPIPIAAMIYVYVILRYGILADAGHRAKIVVLTTVGILFLILVDVVTGFYRWSVNYVFPGGILLLDAATLIMMCINIRNWQSYIMLQMGMILFSVCPIFLWRIHIITHPLFSLVTAGVTVLIILGTLIIGDRRAKIELSRRFHIR